MRLQELLGVIDSFGRDREHGITVVRYSYTLRAIEILTLSRYQAKLAQRPLLTQALTTAVCSSESTFCRIPLTSQRSYLVLVTRWRSRPWRRKDSKTMKSLGRGEWYCMEAVRLTCQKPPSFANEDRCFRPSSYQMVSVLTATNQSPVNKRNNLSAGSSRSDSLCDHQSWCLPLQYGYNGGQRSEAETREELFPRLESQLDALACGPGCEFQIGSARASSSCREYSQSGLELFPELLE